MLVTYPGCLLSPSGPWIFDGEHLLLYDEAPPENFRTIWVVSSVTGQMQRVAVGVQDIVDVLGYFQLP